MLEPMLEIGFYNYVFPSRVIAILNPDIASTKRIIQDAKTTGKFIDVTSNKKISSVIVLDTGDVVLSAIDTKTIQNRYLKRIHAENNPEIDLKGGK